MREREREKGTAVLSNWKRRRRGELMGWNG